MSRINKVLMNIPQPLSQEEADNLSMTLSGVHTAPPQSEQYWRPSVDETGDLSWALSQSDTAPATMNIKGPKGDDGQNGSVGPAGLNPVFSINPNDAHWRWMYEGATSGWTDLGMTASGAVGPQGADAECWTDPAGLISGDGSQASPLGIDGPAVDAISAMASPFMIDGTNHIYVNPDSTTQKVVVGLDNAANNAIDYVGQMAHYWDEVSGVSGKSHATINENQVIEVDNNGTTSAVSAVQYVYNTGFHTAPKQMFVCQDDNDLIGNLGICQGKGTLFFVCSAI